MNATGQSDVISMFLVTFILMPKYYDYVCVIYMFLLIANK